MIKERPQDFTFSPPPPSTTFLFKVPSLLLETFTVYLRHCVRWRSCHLLLISSRDVPGMYQPWRIPIFPGEYHQNGRFSIAVGYFCSNFYQRHHNRPVYLGRKSTSSLLCFACCAAAPPYLLFDAPLDCIELGTTAFPP